MNDLKTMFKKNLGFGEPDEWTRLCERKAKSTFREHQETWALIRGCSFQRSESGKQLWAERQISRSSWTEMVQEEGRARSGLRWTKPCFQ